MTRRPPSRRDSRSPEADDALSFRRGQAIRPWGVGGILDRQGASYVACSTDLWRLAGERIEEPRLEQHLGVERLVAPARMKDDGTPRFLPFFRFPRWMFCQVCRRMQFWGRDRGSNPRCCDQPLVPMRFVLACPAGHLSDLDWPTWVHRGADSGKPRCESRELTFHVGDGGSGLENLIVRCVRCARERTLAGITTPDHMSRYAIRCEGRQPWEQARTPCDRVPRCVPRTAHNLYFPITVSAINIPPHSSYLHRVQRHASVRNHPSYLALRARQDRGGMIFELLRDELARETGVAADVIMQLLEADAQSRDGLVELGELAGTDLERARLLRQQEYEALLTPPGDDRHPRDHFITEEEDLDAYVESLAAAEVDPAFRALAAEVAHGIERLVRVTRLREVRVLRGFSRLAPFVPGFEGEPAFGVYGPDGKLLKNLAPATFVGVDLGTDPQAPPRDRWLPAVEVFGEGIFLTLRRSTIDAWLARNEALSARASSLLARLEPRNPRFALREAGPAALLLHALAHLLMRELSFSAGYALASIRERLYWEQGRDGEPMLGVLLYTAEGDAEGSMGGLVREGRPERFVPTLIRAVSRAQWCSSDPLCGESVGQGPGALNLAACHACLLVPETSCELGGVLLDRALVVGTVEEPGTGFFSALTQGGPTS